MKTRAILRPLALLSLLALGSAVSLAAVAPAAGSRVLAPAACSRVLALGPVSDKLPARFTMPLVHLFTSAREYRLFFGHDAPGVDWSRERVVLFSAGVLEVGHHVASIVEVRRVDDRNSLRITTALASDLCQVVDHPERPFALAKFEAPRDEIESVSFLHEAFVTACGP